VHRADRMPVVLHPTALDATIVLGPSQGGLGGQDPPDGFPASGRNAFPSGVMAFFADVPRRLIIFTFSCSYPLYNSHHFLVPG